MRQKYPDLDPAIEYLDAKRFPDNDHLMQAKDYLSNKYRDRNIDLIYVMDNPALEMVLSNNGEFLKDVPVVFAGINGFEPEMLLPRSKITGITENMEIAGTLEVALALHPNCKDVLAVHDYTVTGKAFRHEMEDILSRFEGRAKVSFTPPATMGELVEQVKSLSPNTLVFLLGFNTDREGRTFPPAEVMRLLASNTSLPMYGVHELRLGLGIVGGFLLGGKEHGRKAGELGLRVLAGENPAGIPVSLKSTARPMFDFLQLARLEIPSSVLPEGSTIINIPESPLDKHKGLILGTIGIIAALVLMVISLGATIYRRRAAENALRVSEVRYRRLHESLMDAFVCVDLDGRIKDCNEAYRKMLGYDSEEIVQFTYMDITPEKWHSMEAEITERQILTRGYSEIYEKEYRRKDGLVFPVELRAFTLTDDMGVPFGMGAIIRDITERAKQNREIKLINRLYSVLSRVNQAVVRATSPGTFLEQACREVVEGGGFLFSWIGRLDPNTCAVFPAASWGGVQQYLKDLNVYADERPEGLGPTGTCIRERKPIVFNDFLHDPSTVRWHQMAESLGIAAAAAFPIERDGVIWGSLTICSDEVDRFGEQDIKLLERVAGDIGFALNNMDKESRRKQAEEERRKLEERLQRAEKMEALGTLAGGVAHDLNNILGIVVGYSEMLLYDLDDPSPHRSRAMAIHKGGQRAALIIQDLLTLARRGVPNREILNLNKILTECQRSPEFEQLIALHPHVRIQSDFEPDLLNISGSSVHLEKSFMNLVLNAAEAMADGGSITIKTRNQYLDKPVLGYDEVKRGDYVVLSVTDEGEGISPTDYKHIFEPFYTRKVMGRSGTGLGLAVVWGTVKDHFGYINVASELGRGTTFTLYFPISRGEETIEQNSIEISDYIGNGESILVVDDEKEQRELAVAMLGKMNYKACSVPGGGEAVEYLKKSKVDLVILDMIMDPGLDGLDTYIKISEIHPRQKAIIVSGFAETDRIRKAQALGAGPYVKKPYLLEKLGLAVREELDRMDGPATPEK